MSKGSLGLSPVQRVELADVFVPLFPRKTDVKELVNRCDIELGNIPEGDTVPDLLANVIETAEKDSWTVDLIQVAFSMKPTSESLRKVAKVTRDRAQVEWPEPKPPRSDGVSDTSVLRKREALIKYVGREGQWQQIRALVGIDLPSNFLPSEVDASILGKSKAVVWRVKNSDAEHLASAMCYWIRNDCQLDIENSDEVLRHQPFTLTPAFSSVVDIFNKLAKDLMDSHQGYSIHFDRIESLGDIDRAFTRPLVEALNRGLASEFSCIASSLSSATESYTKLQKLTGQFCEVWNQLAWQDLNQPLLFVLLDKRSEGLREKLSFILGAKPYPFNEQIESPPIGKYTQTCFTSWYEFLAKDLYKNKTDDNWLDHLGEISDADWQDADYRQLRERLIPDIKPQVR